jgi:hypothetical protein
MPVPGYVAPEEGPTTEAAERAMAQLKALFFDAAEQKLLQPPLLREVSESLQNCVQVHHDTFHADEPILPAETFQAILHCWAALHGFTCLEAYGHLDWLPAEGRDALFDASIRLIAVTTGLPAPQA